MNVPPLRVGWHFALVLLVGLAMTGLFPAWASAGAEKEIGLSQRSGATGAALGSEPSNRTFAAWTGDPECHVGAGLVDVRQGATSRFVQGGASQGGHARVVFDPNVTAQDQELITEAVRLAEDFFAARFAGALGAEVTVTALPISCPRNEHVVASTVGDSMVIYTQSPGWISLPPAERIRVVIHEYTHAYLFSKSADAPVEGAAWLEEGTAEYLSMIALSELGLVNREEIEGLFGEIVDHTDLPALQDLESYSAWQMQPGEVYQLAYFGVAQLLQDLPLSRIGSYYSALQEGTSFAEAFELAFGTTLERFYDEFAQFRANSLPTMGFFPDELEITEGVDQPSAVTVEEAPEFVIPGQQTLVVANAVPGANCTLDLVVADMTVVIDDRETFADGDGQVFWLLTLPADLPPGDGDFVVTCGADPLTIPVLVT